MNLENFSRETPSIPERRLSGVLFLGPKSLKHTKVIKQKEFPLQLTSQPNPKPECPYLKP
jgi:hypothetical protein